MPYLQSMSVEYGDDVTIYALNIRDDEDPRVFMRETGYDFTLLVEADPVMALYNVRPTPCSRKARKAGTLRNQWPIGSFHSPSNTRQFGLKPSFFSVSQLLMTSFEAMSTTEMDPSRIPGKLIKEFCTKAYFPSCV